MKFDEFLNEYFDQIYVINLDHRTDRLNEVNSLLKKYNINFKRQSGVFLKEKYTDVLNNTTNTSSLGHLGCVLSHVNCCIDAIKNNYDKILVLEDDINFIPEHIDSINYDKLLNEVNNIDWGLFYLGGTYNDKLQKVSTYLDRPTGPVLGTQSVGYSREVIEKIGKKIPSDPEYYVKGNRLERVLPIDVIYSRSFARERCIAINPIVCVQNTSISDIVPAELMVDNTEYQLSRWNRNKSR